MTITSTKRTTTKQPAAQVEFAQKAAATKTENATKRPQPAWLQRPMPLLQSDPTPTPERVNVFNQSQGPPRLLSKAEVLAITNATYPTIWAWMRKGEFPRSRVVGGKSKWLSTEVAAWMAALPLRPLKGDTEAA